MSRQIVVLLALVAASPAVAAGLTPGEAFRDQLWAEALIAKAQAEAQFAVAQQAARIAGQQRDWWIACARAPGCIAWAFGEKRK